MLCDGLFPSARSLDNRESEEEERRLFYVAITRARDELHLSYPIYRAIGAGSDTMQRLSRFLDELPRELLDEWNLHARLNTKDCNDAQSIEGDQFWSQLRNGFVTELRVESVI